MHPSLSRASVELVGDGVEVMGAALVAAFHEVLGSEASVVTLPAGGQDASSH